MILYRPSAVPMYVKRAADPTGGGHSSRPRAPTRGALDYERVYNQMPTVVLMRDPKFARWVRSSIQNCICLPTSVRASYLVVGGGWSFALVEGRSRG